MDFSGPKRGRICAASVNRVSTRLVVRPQPAHIAAPRGIDSPHLRQRCARRRSIL